MVYSRVVILIHLGVTPLKRKIAKVVSMASQLTRIEQVLKVAMAVMALRGNFTKRTPI